MTRACGSVDGMFSVHLIRCGKHTATRPLCKDSLLPKVWLNIFDFVREINAKKIP